MTSYESADLWISGLGLAANFGALVFIAVQLFQARQNSRSAAAASQRENTRLARQATLDYYRESLTERNALAERLPTHHDPEGVAAALERVKVDAASRADLRAYLSYFETLATGVNIGVYDVETIERLAGFRVMNTYAKWLPYIEWVRGSGASPTAYVELERLAGDIRRLRENRI